MKTATWNNMSNGCSSDIIVDYDITDSGDNINKYNVWDITSMTREWYSGKSPNYGVMLTSPSETASSMARVMYYASTFPNISDYLSKQPWVGKLLDISYSGSCKRKCGLDQ